MARGLKLLDAYIEVTADGKPAIEKVARDVENDPSSKRVGSSWGKRLVGGIVGSIAVAKIGQFLGQSISNASDLNETVSASRAIYGDASKGLEAWAQTAATSVGLSKGAALEATTAFGDMLTQIGFTGDAAAKNSQNVVQMAADLGSFKNLETGDVLDRISGAMRGEYDSLQKVIPNINAARVENEAMAATGKKTAAELTAQEKAQAVLAIVAKDGSVAMGDFAKTQDSVANQTKIAKAQTEDMSAQLGTALLPLVGQIAGFLTKSVIPALAGMAEYVKQNIDWLLPLVAVLGSLIAIAWLVVTVLTAWNTIQAVLNITMSANVVGLIVIGIVALIAIIVLLIANWDTVVKFLTDTWNGFVSWLTAGLAKLGADWNQMWGDIARFATDTWNGFVGWITGVGNGFVGWWNGLWAGVGNWIKGVWNGFIGWIKTLAVGWVTWLRSMGAGISAWWNGLWTGIGNFVRSIWTGFVSWVKQMATNLYLGIQVVGNSIKSWWNGLWTGIGNLIRNVWNGFVGWVKGIFNGLVGALKGIGGGLKSWWSGLWNSLGSFVGSAFNNAKRLVVNVLNTVIGAVNGAIGGINGLGEAASAITGGVVSWRVSPLPYLGYAKGTRSAADTFIAGENGPEIVTGRKGASVYTAADTRAMLDGGDDRPAVHIENVVIDAKNVRELNDIVDMIQALPQVARANRGTRKAA